MLPQYLQYIYLLIRMLIEFISSGIIRRTNLEIIFILETDMALFELVYMLYGICFDS